MSDHQFVVCVANADYAASLQLRKLYEVLPDKHAARHGHVRIIDESGEESMFAPVEFPVSTEERLLRVA